MSSPVVVGGVVYFGAGDGTFYALNAATGAKIWSYHADNSQITALPAVANGILYVVSGSGVLDAFGQAGSPSVVLSPQAGLAGSVVMASGCGFSAGSTVTATFGDSPIALSGISQADSTGHFIATFTVPSSFAVGTYFSSSLTPR